jgi:Protein of unknown function (DUF3891)
MIVTAADGHLLLVRQTDHQVLSGLLADAWGNERFARPQPFAPLVRAAYEHDNGWHAWEQAPKVDPATRRPYQFTDVPLEEHLAFYRQGIDELATRDPHAGLLVNLHCQGFHNQRFGTMPEAVMTPHPAEREAALKRFMCSLQTHERELGRRISVDTATLWAQYELLQFFDRLSLYLCMPPQKPRELGPVPVGSGGDLLTLRLTPADEGAVRIAEWPFRSPSLSVRVSARRIPNRAYDSDDDLRRELTRAESNFVSHTLRVN